MEDLLYLNMTKKKVSIKEFNELKAKLEERQELHKQYMTLLQNKFEIRIPASITLGSTNFNVILVDKDNKPIEQVKPILEEKTKVAITNVKDSWRSYIT